MDTNPTPYAETSPINRGSPSLSVQHKPLRAALLSYNAGHVLLEEAPHDAAAQIPGPEAPGRCRNRRDGLPLRREHLPVGMLSGLRPENSQAPQPLPTHPG